MHHTKIGAVLAVALLVLTLAAPASAKPGGHGPPSGTGLEITAETNYMWANSPGDTILFDITVTNKSGGLLNITVEFVKGPSAVGVDAFALDKNESRITHYPYTVQGSISESGNTGDFATAPISTGTDVTVGTFIAASGAVNDSADAVITAYAVLPCPGSNWDGFTFGPNADYAECSFTPVLQETGGVYWTLTTTLERPKKGKGPQSPSATVRDGIPGNWCDYDKSGPLAQGDSGDPTVIIDNVYFPSDGVCLHDAGWGDYLVRNHDTFYLATWSGNVVEAAPSP